MPFSSNITRRLDTSLSNAAYLDLDRNPIVIELGRVPISTRVKKTPSFIIQYSFLPRTIGEFLCRGVVRLYQWEPVKNELLRNIGEELGTKTDSLAHFAILKQCLRNEVGLNFDFDPPIASSQTTNMMECIRNLITNGSEHSAAGAVYALEASAVPELMVIGKIINIYSNAAIGRSLISEDFSHTKTCYSHNWTLNRFLSEHITEFEIGHRNLLENAVSPYLITNEQTASFITGFMDVINTMTLWWEHLAFSIISEEVK